MKLRKKKKHIQYIQDKMLIQVVQAKIGIWKGKGNHRSWET